MKLYDHIYLSPHFDDASLSCGGAIHQQVRAGQAVVVVTICAAPPAPGVALSPFAQKIHGAMGHVEDVVAMRRREDRASIDRLGAELAWLDFQDAVYRGREGRWFYASIDEVFGPIHPDERDRPEAIAAAIGEQTSPGPETTLYAPLTVGGHVDHRHAHRAAWMLREQGRRVVFYEDYPYADPAYRLPFDEENTATLDVILASLHPYNLTPHIVRLTEDDLQARIDSVGAYGSQVPMLFGDETAMAERLRTYAMQVDGQGLAERYWVPADVG